jgi:hypothetical protein
MLMGTLGHIGNPGEDDDQFAQSVVQTLKDARLFQMSGLRLRA